MVLAVVPFSKATTDRTGGVDPLTPVRVKVTEVCPTVTETVPTVLP